jgi:hypothetical protein
MTALRNFEPTVVWSDENGLLTERAKGYLRGLWDFIGAANGVIPSASVGAPGGTTTFFRGDGTFSVPEYPIGAAPTGSVGTAPVSGTAVTFLRSDAAPSLNLGITPTWTGLHTFSAGLSASSLVSTSSLTTTTSATIGAGFGCNSKAAQTSASVGAAVVATAATNVAPYGYATQAQADDIVTRLNTIRAALIANGILV